MVSWLLSADFYLLISYCYHFDSYPTGRRITCRSWENQQPKQLVRRQSWEVSIQKTDSFFSHLVPPYFETYSALCCLWINCLQYMNSFSLSFHRSLVKNMLMGYFNTPENKRMDVVRVIGGLLGFTHEELDKVSPCSSCVLYCRSFSMF